MTYEWEEEIPQPKPPTRRARLDVVTVEPDVAHGRPDEWLTKRREATLADIARALGVTDNQLAAFLKNPHMICGKQHMPEWQYQNLLYGQGIGGQQLYQSMSAQGQQSLQNGTLTERAVTEEPTDERLRIGIPKKSGGGKSG